MIFAISEARKQQQLSKSRIMLINWPHQIVVVLVATLSLTELIIGSFASQLDAASVQQQQQQQAESIQRYFQTLYKQDTCGTIYTGKAHGYDVREYKVLTKDNYELTLHRVIHPSEFLAGTNHQGPNHQYKPRRKRKPYLLLHGLIGSSASYMLNLEENYTAPSDPEALHFDAKQSIRELLAHREGNYAGYWFSTADSMLAPSDGARRELGKWPESTKRHAELIEVDMDGDRSAFGREFKQTYRKWELPRWTRSKLASNSLALTLSNYGYDVWLINLRGNQYSRKTASRHSADSSLEYWDFNMDTLVSEDLPAIVQFVQREVACDEPVGFVSYSYNNLLTLSLLTKYPAYLERLQPVFMVAPAVLVGSQERSLAFRLGMKGVTKLLVSKNGPFPSLGRTTSSVVHKSDGTIETKSRKKSSSSSSSSSIESLLQRLICNLPLASRLCRSLETVLSGRGKRMTSVSGLLFSDSKEKLIRRDMDCGQTSTAVLHQLIENLNMWTIHSKYEPFKAAELEYLRTRRPLERSVILVHSDSDEISTMSEVEKIKHGSLKQLTLADYVIREPNFGHTDFLFSKRNQYLVNAEIARMALVYDYVLYRK